MKKSIKFAEDINETDEEEASRWKYQNRNMPRPSIVQLNNTANANLTRETVTVELRLIILKLGSISTKENRFSCEAFLEASWYDKEIVKNLRENSKVKYDDRFNWNPHLYIQNLVSNQSQEIWYSVEKTTLGYKVSERRRFKGEFSQTFNLHDFPLDLQELCISISSFRTPQEINLIVSQEKLSSINVSTFTQTHEWTLYQTVCNNKNIKSTDYSNDLHCTVEMSVVVTRNPNYYYWNSFLLIFIITMICLCCFSIRCDISSNRMIVSITVLLTLITFKRTLTRNLPSLSYLTSLDQYSLMNILIVFLNCLYHAILGVLTTEFCPTPFKQIDFYAFIGSAVFFYSLNSLYLIRFFLIKFRNRKIIAKREVEYNKNNYAKRARIKSIFQNSQGLD